MPTRRQTLIGVMALVFGGAGATVGAFTSSTQPTTDVRVVVESELSIVPTRGEDGGRYVEVDDDGRVEAFTFPHLNTRAITDFAGLARIVNNSGPTFDRFEMTFAAEDADGDSLASVAEALKIVGDAVDDGSDGVYTLLAGDEELPPGEGVTFGVGIDLLPESDPGDIEDLPDETVNARLEIDGILD